MQLLNADGSPSEVSGNGVRCLAAWIAESRSFELGRSVAIETDAGMKRLELLDVAHGRYTFRAAMGPPEQIQRVPIAVHGADGRRDHAARRQPAVRRPRRGHARSACTRSAAALAVHPHFPARHERRAGDGRGARPRAHPDLGTRRRPDGSVRHRRVRRRGGGDAFGGAARDVQVDSPGGTQRVEWRDEGLFLTGWAEIVAECRWMIP